MDLYCIICGGCSWNKFEKIEYNEFVNQSKEMCNYIKNNKNISDDRLINNLDKYNNIDKYIDNKMFNKIKKEMKFMDNITILAQDNTIIKNADWIDRNNYIDPTKEIFTRSYYVYPNYNETLEDNDKYYIGAKYAHTDCWRYIKHKYNKELKYSDLTKYMVKNNNITKLSPLNIDYDIMENYWQEDFGFLIENIILDKQYYLLYSPLNILKKIKELKRIKKKSKNHHVS
jgi:hypothetical protein